MAAGSRFEIRVGEPGNVLEIQIGTVEVDVPRSVGYFGGLAAAVGLGLIEPPLAVFIAAVPLYKALTNTVLPRPLRVIGEVLEGAAKPVGSDADGVIQLEDQQKVRTNAVNARELTRAGRSATSSSSRRRAPASRSSAARAAKKASPKRTSRAR